MHVVQAEGVGQQFADRMRLALGVAVAVGAPLAAAALLVTAPVLLLTLLMQREIVAGLTAGGVKGG